MQQMPCAAILVSTQPFAMHVIECESDLAAAQETVARLSQHVASTGEVVYLELHALESAPSDATSIIGVMRITETGPTWLWTENAIRETFGGRVPRCSPSIWPA